MSHAGLCADCENARVITSDRGSRFTMCQLSKDDPRYPKYPPQPVAFCAGHEKLPSPP